MSRLNAPSTRKPQRRVDLVPEQFRSTVFHSPNELPARGALCELRLVREPHEVAARAPGHVPCGFVRRLPGAEPPVERGHEPLELPFGRRLPKLGPRRPIDLAIGFLRDPRSELRDTALRLVGPAAGRDEQ